MPRRQAPASKRARLRCPPPCLNPTDVSSASRHRVIRPRATAFFSWLLRLTNQRLGVQAGQLHGSKAGLRRQPGLTWGPKGSRIAPLQPPAAEGLKSIDGMSHIGVARSRFRAGSARIGCIRSWLPRRPLLTAVPNVRTHKRRNEQSTPTRKTRPANTHAGQGLQTEFSAFLSTRYPQLRPRSFSKNPFFVVLGQACSRRRRRTRVPAKRRS